MSIYLTATIKSKPESIENLKALLLQLVSSSKKETACLQYNLHQYINDPSQFIFYEEWADAAGLELHNTQPHLHDFVTQSKDLIEGKIQIHQTEKIG